MTLWERAGVETKLLDLISNDGGVIRRLQSIINDAMTKDDTPGGEDNDELIANRIGSILTTIIADTLEQTKRAYVSCKRFSQAQLNKLFVFLLSCKQDFK